MPGAMRPLEETPVESVMTRHPATIEREATLSDAAEKMARGGFRHLPVVDGAGRLVGMLSERDLRARLGSDLADWAGASLEALSETVSEVMSPDPLSIGPATPLAEALEVFADERVGALAVVDESDGLLGIVSYVDLLGYLRERGAPARPAPGDFEEPAAEEEPPPAGKPGPAPRPEPARKAPAVPPKKAPGKMAPRKKAPRKKAAPRRSRRKAPRGAAARKRPARKAPRRR